MGYQKFKELENCDVEMYLNNHFSTVFASENLNNVPDFKLSYRKKNRDPSDIFQDK